MRIKFVNYWDKYTEMHGQQNVKIYLERRRWFKVAVVRLCLNVFIFTYTQINRATCKKKFHFLLNNIYVPA